MYKGKRRRSGDGLSAMFGRLLLLRKRGRVSRFCFSEDMGRAGIMLLRPNTVLKLGMYVSAPQPCFQHKKPQAPSTLLLTRQQCYYSALDGYDNLTWADATLTPLGEQQATDVNTLWTTQLQHGLPPPESYYVSPLTRAIQTADLTFSTLPLPYTPHVKDPLREALGVHTCDRRSTLSHLRTTFPHLVFDPSFPDPDTLWRPDYREPRSARKYRLETLLDDVFANDDGVFVSLTSHSGAIGSILEAVGHRAFRLETGGVVPVFVRGVRVRGERRVPEWEPSEAGPMCDGPPEGV